MLLEAVELRDFRSYQLAHAEIGPQLTVVHGPNGAGKSNLLEAICFACTGRSPRTRNDRELIRFGASATRVDLALAEPAGPRHTISVGFGPAGDPPRPEKRIRFDGAPLERADQIPDRPLIAVFVPERMALIGGAPAVRRAHMDNLLAALWPTRAGHRAAYSRALSQRNALLSRIRAGAAGPSALAGWDGELARHALQLSEDRAEAVSAISTGFAEMCAALGLAGSASISYRPSSKATDLDSLIADFSARLPSDLERGFTTHGPHRDELAILRDGRSLRTYGSQGERRLALLALLLSERAALAALRPSPPVAILDDVMSELDSRRRELLVHSLTSTGGQSLIATTDPSHVPVPRPHLVAVEHVRITP